ncbi:MAG: DUF3127 domain-containing protein [Bacteroidetes bacterium]|nr:DUF3127 domain-containing protein [Bacteroidota bacterium]
MDITGTIRKILPEVTGQGKNGIWRRQDFIIETKDEFPRSVCISTWGDKVSLTEFSESDEVKVSFNLESREYNNRWYTDVRAWRVERVSGDAPPYTTAPETNAEGTYIDTISEEDDLPF